MRKGKKTFLALLAGAFLIFSVSCNGDSETAGQTGDQGGPGALSQPSDLASAPGADTPDSDRGTTPSDTGDTGETGEDPVWIRVNGEPIHKSQVKEMETFIKRQFGNRGQIPEELLKRAAMMNATQMELIDQAAEAEDIEIDPADVEEQIDMVKKQIPGDKELDAYLKSMGMSEAELREQIRTQLVHRELLEEKTKTAEPTEKEIKAEYEEQKTRFKQPPQVKVKHIMLSVPPTADEQQKKEKKELAESIRKKLEGGADFMELAKEHSDFGGTEKDVVRTFKKGTMPQEFDKTVFNLEAGQISPVIETGMGFHIVKVMEKKEGSTAPLAEVRDRIVKILQTKGQQEAIGKYLEGLKEKADIEYIEPLPEEPTAPQGMRPPQSP